MSDRDVLDALAAAGVFADPQFLDAETCRLIRRRMDQGLIEAAEILDRGVEDAVRRASNIEVDESLLDAVEARLDRVRDELSAFFESPLGEREGASFLRYGHGGFYKPHRDRGDSPDWPGASRRRVALVVFLNGSRGAQPGGDFAGGALQLFVDAEPLDVLPRRGMLVAFPADVLHQVTRVSGGTRDTIVDWYYAEA